MYRNLTLVAPRAGPRCVKLPAEGDRPGTSTRPIGRECPSRRRSYPVILTAVKTAISIPDATFERATNKAQALGMSRSEFFTRAAVRYLDELDASSVAEQIDLVVASLDGVDDSTRDAVSAGLRTLAVEVDDW
jgi:hypothetical protein